MEVWGYVSLFAWVITETWEAATTEAHREAISAGADENSVSIGWNKWKIGSHG